MSYDQGNPGHPDPWSTPPPPGYGQPGTQPYGYGQPGDSQAGHPDPVSGQPASGQPASGQPMSGQPMSGQPVSGQPRYDYPPPPPPYGPAGYGAAGYGPPGYGQQVPTTPDERNMATIAHVLSIFLGWIGALIIYVIKKDESRFVRHHAAEALNLTLTAMIVTIATTIVGCVLSLLVIGFLLLLLLIPYSIMLVVFMIIAAMAANRGELYTYPAWLRFPMVK